MNVPSRGLEVSFDAAFATELALREKQIQQNYRPVIGIHKWFARRPGTIFRSLLLAEYATGPLRETFWQAHAFTGIIGDPFMGGGTPIYEANRLGFHVVGCDINPMAHWIVGQSLSSLDLGAFHAEAKSVVEDVDREVSDFYRTKCSQCGGSANVKYFIWVKTAACPHCRVQNDLFPGYLLAEAERHPRHVLACATCGALNEYETPPSRKRPGKCVECGHHVHIEGNVSRKKLKCRACERPFTIVSFNQPPHHRMWAIEYHCKSCYSGHPGRQFKRPDKKDLALFKRAEEMLHRREPNLPIPADEIPRGDESDRLLRWGYRRYREMFNARQLLGLGLLLRRIQSIGDRPIRNALLTVFSDTIRYQNMLCRYDTYALKCQDIFSVHGFPVGLIQCENSLLGVDSVGSGAFRHFIDKYARAKQYCAAPFETRQAGRRKEIVPIEGETIEAELVNKLPVGGEQKQALLVNAPSQRAPIEENSLDGVFTDPPYFDNVQYAELIDFCFAWLRQVLAQEHQSFSVESTRSPEELTGNETLGRDLEHFTRGVSEIFCLFTKALKPGGPFVFTYHHNDPVAYLPIVVAILDAGLECTATLPAAAEMTASLHIAGTSSSILDSVFVCRKPLTRCHERTPRIEKPLDTRRECKEALKADVSAMKNAGLETSQGDLRCILAGHIARIAIRTLRPDWNPALRLTDRMERARSCLERVASTMDVGLTVGDAGRTASQGASRALSREEFRT